MSMRLALLRHGIAIDRDDPDCPDDPDRFLTEEGVAKTKAAARGFAATGFVPDAVISSPYVRARETAEIAVRALGFSGELEIEKSLIWMKPPKQIVSNLAERKAKDVLLVGHAPHLDELTAYLSGASRAFTSLKKASVAIIECLELKRGGGYVTALYPPRVLRSMAPELTL